MPRVGIRRGLHLSEELCGKRDATTALVLNIQGHIRDSIQRETSFISMINLLSEPCTMTLDQLLSEVSLGLTLGIAELVHFLLRQKDLTMGCCIV